VLAGKLRRQSALDLGQPLAVERRGEGLQPMLPQNPQAKKWATEVALNALRARESEKISAICACWRLSR